eukprot:COSAG01_NODE_2308_length_7944_cov_6.146718_7_plen_109_part_00
MRTKICTRSRDQLLDIKGLFLRTEHFSRIIGPNRMAIPAAAEFLFCRFRRFREIMSFLSDVQSSVPRYRLQLYSCTIEPASSYPAAKGLCSCTAAVMARQHVPVPSAY